MRRIILGFLGFGMFFSAYCQAPEIVPSQWPGIHGLWTFDNPNSLLQAEFGTDLVLSGTHTVVPGPVPDDGAVNIGVGSYYRCFHNIPANGGGSDVNEYSMVIDFRVPSIGPWYCFYQANFTNSNDGELFVNTTGKVGRGTNGPGYTAYTLLPGEWYRLVVTADLGNQYKIYLDGIMVRQGGSLAIDGDFSLDPQSGNNSCYLFADNDGEAGPLDVALCAIFEGVLSGSDVETLGGYGHAITPLVTGILPYLQSPTPNSIYISWHSDSLASTQVEYGTTATLGLLTTGSFENIGTKKWHTVKLENLQPNTPYFYRCISGGQQSGIKVFRTPLANGTSEGHFRVLVFSDSQSNSVQSTAGILKARQKAIELYGDNIQNNINLIMHSGDIVGDGTNLQGYENELFNPFSYLSANIPLMAAIGNHEADNAYYYQYMKYEDFNGAPPASPERYYSYRLARIQFVVINTNTAYQNSTQLTWLSNTLNAATADTSVDFIMLYGHQPAWSEIWPYGNTGWVQNQVFTLLKAHPKVALYSCGHTHSYEHAVYDHQDGNSGFHQIIVGGAGGGLDRWGMFTNQANYPETMKSLDHHHFLIIDFDLAGKSFEAKMYSLGHPDKPLDAVVADRFHKDYLATAPVVPQAMSPAGTTFGALTLTASAYSGSDSLMSSWFQLTAVPGDYSNPLINIRRDKEDFYGDSGAPDYLPVNLNSGVNLTQLEIGQSLTEGQTYAWRVRYRDHNLNWSAWSAEQSFLYTDGVTIQGQVTYDNATSTALAGVTVYLMQNNDTLDQVQTDANGQYNFDPQLPGNYTLSVHSTAPWGAVNSTDALLVLRHFVGISLLSGLKKKAADVNGDQYINSLDALFVARRFTGQMTGFPTGDWIFETISLPAGAGQTLNQPIKGIITGDVNASY